MSSSRPMEKSPRGLISTPPCRPCSRRAGTSHSDFEPVWPGRHVDHTKCTLIFRRNYAGWLCISAVGLKASAVIWSWVMGIGVKLVTSALALALAAVSVGSAQAQSITQALTIAYDHAPDLQSALLSAKASAENV